MRDPRGGVQSTLVVTLSVLTLLALAVTIVFAVRKQIDQRNQSRKNAQEAAEYGMMIALQKIEENPQWQEGFTGVKYKDASYDVKIEKTGENSFRAQSTGTCRSIKLKVICAYELVEEEGVLKPRRGQLEYQ
jgi:hypothetical protein